MSSANDIPERCDHRARAEEPAMSLTEVDLQTDERLFSAITILPGWPMIVDWAIDVADKSLESSLITIFVS